MASKLHGPSWLQPFDQSVDPPTPAWLLHSRWYLRAIRVSVMCTSCAGAIALFALMEIPILDSMYTIGLLAFGAAISLGVAVAEWQARLRQRALNTLVITAWGTVALSLVSLGRALGT